MVDYYCANSYPYPGLGYLWNVVDAMLKEKKLGSSEKEFYSALKDSYGSLYKIHFDKKGAFLLEDLIEPKPLFSVNDVGMDHDMVGEVIFARPLKLKKQTILADGAFIYPEELVSKITTLMKEITNQMHYRLERLSLAEILSNGYRSKEEMFAAIRKVWSKDIVAEYTNYLLCKKADTMKNEKVMH
jgi:hypothetical protein